MAAEFLGLTVLVKLNSPPNTALQGLVSNVQGQRLFLHNVFFPVSGHHLSEYVVHGSEIADIEVVAHDPQPVSAPNASQDSAPLQRTHAVQSPHSYNSRQLTAHTTPKPTSNFVDPAILSFTRTPSGLATAQEASTQNNVSATLTKPFNELAIEKSPGPDNAATVQGDPHGEDAATGFPREPVPGNGSHNGKKQRQRKRVRNAVPTSANAEDSSPEIAKSQPTAGDGWRKTPILQEHVSHASTLRGNPAIAGGAIAQEAAGSTRKRKGRKKQSRENIKAVQNGWATEDATDVQELGDFDFAGNLSMFDKQAVFKQLRNEDTTADEDRLVSFNRIAPGTFGGKNLHPLENVLERPRGQSPSSLGSEDEFDLGASMGSRQMVRVHSRTSARQPPSRKNSSNMLENVNPILLTRNHRALNQSRLPTSQVTASPSLHGFGSPSSPSHIPSTRRRAAFRYTQTDRICPTIEPDFLDSVEELACAELGFTEDILAENAARGIAEVALSSVSPGGRRLGQSGHNPQPVVVILAGDHRTGARAIAAARHLRERRIRVVVSLSISAVEGSRSYLTSQLSRLGGDVLTWKETSAYLKTLEAPPELIIDGLLGADSTLADMSPEDEKTAMDMIGWANKSRASVLSVDLPAGIDAVTGEVEVREGEPAEIRAKFVVCCGAPCVGLLRAIQTRSGEADDWRLFVCDVGINQAWRLALQRSREKRSHKGINFWSGWVLGLSFDSGEQ